MRNVELFNEYVLRVFDRLFDTFPIPCVIDPAEFVASVELSPYPPNPVISYCGPDMSWSFGTKDSAQTWLAHPWDETIEKVESTLGRALTALEQAELRRSGQRPLSTEEQQAITQWEKEKRNIDSLRATQHFQREEAELKQRVFVSTLQFLTNENLIRFTDLPPPDEGQVLLPPDILIARSARHLRFVLTSHGFTHLNRTFESGKIGDKMTLYQAIKQSLKEKAIDGAGAVGVQTLVGWILS